MKKPRTLTYGLGRIYRKATAGVPYGSYYIQFSARGVVHRENAKTRDEQTALRLLKQRLGEVASGKPLGRGAGRTTLGDLGDALAARYALEDRPNGRNLPANRAAWEAALGAATRAADVTTAQLDGVAARWRRGGVAPATINRRLEMLRRAYRLGAAVTPPTVAHVQTFPPKLEEDNVREGFVSAAVFWRLHEAIAARGDLVVQDFVEWLFWTGMRTGAVKELEWTAVDRERWALSLVRRQRRNKGKPKWLPLAGPLRGIMERAWARRIAHAQATGRAVPWVFWRVYTGAPRPGLVAGDAVRVVDFRKAWDAACAVAGCPGLTPHDLRRVALKQLRKHADEARCMEISGHKTASTYRRYNIVEEGELGATLAAVFTTAGRPPAGASAPRRGRRRA